MPLTIWNCVSSYKQKKSFSQNRLLLPSHYFATELPSSNVLPPTFSTGGKWDFQVAHLLLLISNPGNYSPECSRFNNKIRNTYSSKKL